MADDVYSMKQIEGWQSQLQDFAKTPRTRFSKKQAVEALIDDIEAALLAHPYDEVAEKLKAWGLDIAAGSLKQYVNAYRRAHSEGASNSTRKRSGKKARAKKKTAVNNTTESPQTAVDDDGQVDDEVRAVQAELSRSGKRTKRADNRTPDGFLEMPEDL